MFKMRTTKPEKGNKYYNTVASGGCSYAIKGKPEDPDCDVLANCVGYAYGRFNEIGGYGYCKYLSPVNAENFIQFAGNLKVGQIPKVGACMVWRKGATLSNSDGAGHVAIVEKVVSDTQVLTSESGYNASRPFWTQNRYKGTGNWGMGPAYVFLGFIYNPAVDDDDTASTGTSTSGTASNAGGNTSVPTEPLKFKVGDIVEFTGDTHYASAMALNGSRCSPGKVQITALFKRGYHQYHVKWIAGGGSTAYGWVDADDIIACDEDEKASTSAAVKVPSDETDDKKNFEIGDILNFKGDTHYAYANAAYGPKCSPGKVKVTDISKGSKHPYHVMWIAGGGSTAYGWVDAEDLESL